jgi:DNA primase
VFKGLLDNAKSVVDFQIDVLSRESKLDTDAAIMRVSNAVLNTIAQSANAVQRAAMLKTAAERLGIPLHTLDAELTRAEKRVRTFSADETRPPPAELSPKEMALIEHLLAEPKLALLVKKYLPLDLVVNDLGRKVIGFCMQAAENGRDIMGVLAENDGPERELAALAARALGAPAKIKSEFATHEESVKLLILALRQEALRRRRKEIKTRLQAAQLSGSMPEQERKKLEIENGQIEYDLHKMKQWDTALPVLELI